jgi:hypothetical protein
MARKGVPDMQDKLPKDRRSQNQIGIQLQCSKHEALLKHPLYKVHVGVARKENRVHLP